MISYTDLFTPASWLIIDLVTIACFFIMVGYVIKKEENPTPMVFAMFAFLAYSGIFENIGHGYTLMHPYSPYRLFRSGNIATTVSMLESLLFFAAYYLVKQLKVPKMLRFTKPVMVAFLATLPDFLIDPVMAVDTYIFEGVEHAQWNWHWVGNATEVYENAFYTVPFYNFSGWYFLMLWFGISLAIGQWVHKKSGYNKIVGYIYPAFLPITSMMFMVLPTSKIFLFGNMAGESIRVPELIMLVIWTVIAVTALFISRRVASSFSFRTEWPLLVLPIAVELVYGAVAFARGLSTTYSIVAVITVIHVLFAVYIVMQSKRRDIA